MHGTAKDWDLSPGIPPREGMELRSDVLLKQTTGVAAQSCPYPRKQSVSVSVSVSPSPSLSVSVSKAGYALLFQTLHKLP